jgi:hypothetical protein
MTQNTTKINPQNASQPNIVKPIELNVFQSQERVKSVYASNSHFSIFILDAKTLF